MAWSSYHTSSPFNPNRQDSHDVFLSFRGEDTRYSFTSHLDAALTRLKIKTYMDYNLERGDQISSTLLGAIEGSKVSVIVFSRNYANSKWCLEELEKIIECKRRKGQIVVPIFYDVDPSNVRHQTGVYADSFARHEQLFRASVQKVQRWRMAMTEAANLSGWDCMVNRMESQLVEEIAIDVLQKLERMNNGNTTETQIARQQQAAQVKLMEAVRSRNPSQMEDLIAINQNILQLKMDKFFRMAGLLR